MTLIQNNNLHTRAIEIAKLLSDNSYRAIVNGPTCKVYNSLKAEIEAWALVSYETANSVSSKPYEL